MWIWQTGFFFYFMGRYSNEWFLLTHYFLVIHPTSFISTDIILMTRFIHITNGCGHMISKTRIMYTAQWQTLCKGDNCVRHGWVDIQKFVCKSIIPYIVSWHNVWSNNAVEEYPHTMQKGTQSFRHAFRYINSVSHSQENWQTHYQLVRRGFWQMPSLYDWNTIKGINQSINQMHILYLQSDSNFRRYM